MRTETNDVKMQTWKVAGIACLAGLVLSGMAAGTFVSLAVASGVRAAGASANAHGEPQDRARRMGTMGTIEATPAVYHLDELDDGRLLLPTAKDGEYLAAPRVGTWVEVDINGPAVFFDKLVGDIFDKPGFKKFGKYSFFRIAPRCL